MDNTSTSSGAQTSGGVPNDQSLSIQAPQSSRPEEIQEHTSPADGIPQDTRGIHGTATAPEGGWVPDPVRSCLLCLFHVMFWRRQKVNPESPASTTPEALPAHSVAIGNDNLNAGNVNSSYNTTNYSGNAKNFGQGGTVNLNGATVH